VNILPPGIAPADTVALAYTAWRQSAGTTGVNDALTAARRLHDFIDRSLNATILALGTPLGGFADDGESARNSRERAGWYDGDRHVYLLRSTLVTVLGSYSTSTFLRHAQSAGALLKGEGKNLQPKVPKLKPQRRAYLFDRQALAAWCEQAEANEPIGVEEWEVEE
jgi:hypothetical protein